MASILSARYAIPLPPGGYPADASVIAVHATYGEQHRRANDDIDDGGMLAFLADGGVIGPYVAPDLNSGDVDRERDRRLRTFVFSGVAYDFDEASRALIDKARVSAMNYIIVAGPQPGNLRWADPNMDFGWIAADNNFHTMDAETCLSFGTSAASWEGRHILAARAIKNLSPIPADYASNARWP